MSPPALAPDVDTGNDVTPAPPDAVPGVPSRTIAYPGAAYSAT